VNNGLIARLEGVPPAAAWRIYDDAWTLLTRLGAQTALGKVVRHGVDLAEQTGQWQRGWDIVTARLPVETDAVERVVLGAKAAFLALERGNDDAAVRLFDEVTAGAHGMDQYWARIYQALLDVAVSARLRGPAEALRALTRYRVAVNPAEHQARAYRAVQAGIWALDSGVTPGQVRGFVAAIGVQPGDRGSASAFAHLECALLEAEGAFPAAVAAGQRAIRGDGAGAAWRADTHTRLGRCLLREGRLAPARTQIQTALDLLTQWPGWRREAAQAVAARLDDPQRELTDREGEITALVAEALTNQEIADRLGISARTVAVHMSRILAKTGSRSRTELAVSTLRGNR
jgi:DNA-binding CsgD family transcriptional regulator